VIACVRAARLPDAETGVVAANGAFENATPKQWSTLTVSAAELLDNVHAPKFAAPWVGFLLIVNTYKADLGLKIAEYRVTRPGTA
jgi:RNA polymerase subunit RPABC4/transcription elongation factor Spt4